MTDLPNLSLSELNAIAAEFGIVFERAMYEHYMCVYAKRIDAPPGNTRLGRFPFFRIGKINDPTAIRAVLADRCEDAGLRWAEPIRLGRQSPYAIFYGRGKIAQYTIVD